MNKLLLVWNILLTVLLFALVLGGCTSDSRVDWAVAQIQTLTSTVGQLQSTVDQNSQQVQNNAIQIATLQMNLSSAINQIQTYLQTIGH